MIPRLKAALERLTLAHLATLRIHVDDFTQQDSELFAALPDILVEILAAEDANTRAAVEDPGLAYVEAATAWRDYAKHQEWCRSCAEDSKGSCYDGTELLRRAEKIDKRLDEMGVAAFNGSDTSAGLRRNDCSTKLLRDRFAELLDYAKDLTRPGDPSAHMSRWCDFENLLREIEHDSTSQEPQRSAWLAGFLAGANAYDRQRTHSSSGVCDTCKAYLEEALDQVSRVDGYGLTEDMAEARSVMETRRRVDADSKESK